VDESHDDPDGSRFEALIKLHLLADKLQDSEMMNMLIDELIRMVEEDGLIPNHVSLIYSSTTRDSMLRVLVRDIYVHKAESAECHEFLETSDLHPEFWRDISLEYFRLKNTENSIGEVYGLRIGQDEGVRRYDYHDHDGVQRCDRAGARPRPTTAATSERLTSAAPHTSGRKKFLSEAAAAAAALDALGERARPVPQPSARSVRQSSTGGFMFRR
jgi:hypothetical protein